MATLEQALETASQLPLEQQEMLADILRQRQNDQWRRQVAADALESISAFREGKFTVESSADAVEALRKSLDSSSTRE